VGLTLETRKTSRAPCVTICGLDTGRQGENLRGYGSFRWRNRAAHRLCFFCHESMAFSLCGSAYTETAAVRLPSYLRPVRVSPSRRNTSKRSCSHIVRPISSTERAHPIELEISKIQTEFETNAHSQISLKAFS
jgi:hypothetical protein